jgi:hypothetical protein
MWTTLALYAALSAVPGQSGLSLTNVRSTYGLLGPERRSEELAPGDVYFVSFNIEGITVGEEGKVRYSIGTTVTDAGGKVQLQQEPKETEATISLGGNSVAAYNQLTIGLDTAPGDYRLKVTVTDRASGKEQSLTRNIKVLPRSFALVRTTVSLDTNGQYPAEVFTCGQGLWVQCSAVEFARDRGSKQPDLVFEVRIYDESGKPTMAKPLLHTINKNIPANENKVPLAFPLSLNRAGKFTIEVLANDRLKNKKSKTTIPITVLSTQKG